MDAYQFYPNIRLYLFAGVCNPTLVSGSLKETPYFYRHKN
jgi:hypothetical protein